MCTRKAKTKRKSRKQDIATGKYSGSQAPKNSAADDLRMDLGLKAKNQAYYRDLEKRKAASKKALEDMKTRRKRKRKRAAETATVEVTEEPKVETVTTDGVDATMGPQTGDGFPDRPISETDIETATDGTIGETGVTAESIYQRDPEEAISDQERLAQEELRRQRIKRARAKQSLLRRRLERSREVGSGRRVLSGTERELNIQTRQAGTGRRRGAGRRSLITGSTGGIGYYSRFL